MKPLHFLIFSFVALLFASFSVETVQAVYDPTTGRFLSRDPIAEKGGINLYQYVGNNPVNFVDPLGLIVEGTYSISKQTISLQDQTRTTGLFKRVPATFFSAGSSGDNNLKDVSQRGTGPLPPGDYKMYPRPGGIGGLPAYILDPVDSIPLNDQWDGRSDGILRNDFRLHLAVPQLPRSGSDGCLVLNPDDLTKLSDFLKLTAPGPSVNINSLNPDGTTQVFPNVPYLGTLHVVP